MSGAGGKFWNTTRYCRWPPPMSAWWQCAPEDWRTALPLLECPKGTRSTLAVSWYLDGKLDMSAVGFQQDCPQWWSKSREWPAASLHRKQNEL